MGIRINAKGTTRKDLYNHAKKIKNKKICKAPISRFGKVNLRKYIARNGKKLVKGKAKAKPRAKARTKTRPSSRPKRNTKAPKRYGYK